MLKQQHLSALDAVSVAITGASGAQYAIRLIQCLLSKGIEVHLMMSDAAKVVIATEVDPAPPSKPADFASWLMQQAQQMPASQAKPELLQLYGKQQWTSRVASGSNAPRAMVVCPCSTGSLSAFATGASNNLIERAADVMLKERKQLIIVPREAPFSEIHLENMLKLTRMGAVIIPAAPGFYHQPKTIDDLIDFVVARILDHLQVPHQLTERWGK
ncbi:UbiX family flavin prenyltransferase [Pelagibaculum spongiae]|uniref:Flavin prenyltransferase UbiX n=1 Tax=Pelagibaculum spongiae TaxID=2080658 RepID=A0A2V1GQK2_9GAMM|nr:flavin prenyltransferase UbiX [Pelagibaculum spongiae]PVZ65468.1 aromatic acid decarboxylase [Pelagibaculum spongiae]